MWLGADGLGRAAIRNRTKCVHQVLAMSNKRKTEERERRRLSQLAAEGRLADGVEIPRGAVLADRTQQAPNNSYSPPPLYYLDIEFKCSDCGRDEIWTAEQQKWYYEVAKGSLYATAIRCRECRNRVAEERSHQGAPNPFKHPAIILARLRTAIEPSLLAAGFVFDGRNKPSVPLYLYLDYSRGSELFRLSWDSRDSNPFLGVSAELLGDAVGQRLIAAVDLSSCDKGPRNRTAAEIQIRIDSFVEAVNNFLNRLARPGGG
jgi:hypothetical protein